MPRHHNQSSSTLSAPNFELQSWPFYWITQTAGRYVATIEKALEDIELDLPRWRVLMLLDSERGHGVSYLAREAIVKLSTMTRLVQRMEEEGLIVTGASNTDARVTEVRLTANGRRARQLAWQQAQELYREVFAARTLQEIESLNAMLRDVMVNLDRLQP
ncbi:MAG: MarR family winged helix-turn-helix transcriptional regulator [Pseudomonadota bacterium]